MSCAISITGRMSKMRRRSSPSSQLAGKRVNHHSANRDYTFGHSMSLACRPHIAAPDEDVSLHGATTAAGVTSGADARASATWRRRQRRRGKNLRSVIFRA